MAFVKIFKENLAHNYRYLDKLFKKHNNEWAVVTKMWCGNQDLIEYICELGAKEICDSRISNLKVVKKVAPHVQTVYIKPPAKRIMKSLVKYADVSFNTELETIRLISKEAVNQNKTHKIIIMIELGDLREGVMGDELIDFYGSVFNLPNIEVSGIGTNLNCLYGVMPSTDKLIQLSLYKQLIEARFNRKIPWISGGTSVVIPLLLKEQVPPAINHFRVGEALYFGNNLVTGKPFKNMRTDILKLYAEIIEINEKPINPTGQLEENPSGETFEIKEENYGKTSYRGILDLGLLDINPDFITPDDKKLELSGASSDMIVIDLGENPRNYKVGDLVSFDLKYMGALSIMNSDYIEKVFV